MKLSEDTIKKAIQKKAAYDHHVAAIQKLVAELHTVFVADAPEITQLDTIHWLENFTLEEPHEN